VFNLPEVGDQVNITVRGEVTKVRPDKNEDGEYEFQVHVKAPDGDTYVVNLPRPGVSISIPPKTDYYMTYNTPASSPWTQLKWG
jgi:hypothetical protein